MKHKLKMLVGIGLLIGLAQGKTIRNWIIDWVNKPAFDELA